MDELPSPQPIVAVKCSSHQHAAQIGGIGLLVLEHFFGEGTTGERRPARQEIVKGTPQAINVRPDIDVGIAGPLAGFIFLVPALGVGLAFSKVIPDLISTV